MLSLPWIFNLSNYFSEHFYRPPPGLGCHPVCFIRYYEGGSVMDDYLKQFREMVSLRGLTDHTLDSYSTYISAYLAYLNDVLHKQPGDVSWQDLRDFIKWIQLHRSLSDRTINTCISQLRFFTLYVLHKPWDDTQLPLRKFDVFLPFVPSREEAELYLSSVPDLKERVMLVLMYSSGLRLGEVCSLRYEDIDRKHLRIHIRRSKNRSGRFAILSKRALDMLTSYWFAYNRPTGWLFPQKRNPEKHYNPDAFSNRFTRYRSQLGWNARLTCHSFRHAFGTHLYENGTDLLTIKELLGHRSLGSTLVYVHLASNGTSNAVSPFDRMGGYHG